MISFELPDRYIADLASGALRRIGSTLRRVGDGQIVGHVQETGQFSQSMAEQHNAAIPADSVSDIVSTWQPEQIRTLLSGLRMFSAEPMTAALVGVGICVASHVLISKRLSRIEIEIAEVWLRTIVLQHCY